MVVTASSGLWGSRRRHAGDAVECVEEVAPDLSPYAEHGPPLGGEAIEAAAALAGLLHPAPFDPAALFELVQKRVQRRRLELEPAVRPLVDQLRDFVAMPLRPVEH